MNTVKQRNALIDAAKGLGILLVVLGHAFQSRIGDFDNIAFRFIYSFHMPLFMFLSGCVARYGDYRSVTKNISRLVVPFFCWYGVVALVVWYRSGDIPNVVMYMVNLLKGPDTGLWFLWVLFLCHVCFYIMSQAQKYFGIIAALLVFLVIQFIPGTLLGVYLLKWHFVFFVSGYLVMRYKDYFVKARYYLMPLSALVYFLLFPYWQFVSNDVFLSAAHLVPHDFGTGTAIKLFRYATALSGIGMVISLVYFMIKMRPVEKLLTLTGLYTLEIYVSHQMFLGYFLGDALWMRIVTTFFTALTISLVIAFILKRIPYIKTALYGLPTERPTGIALPGGVRK